MSDDLWKMTAVEAVARAEEARDLAARPDRGLGQAHRRGRARRERAADPLPRPRPRPRQAHHGGREPAKPPAKQAGSPVFPVSIKDLTDVAGVRTTYGSPIFANHVPAKSHPLVERIERKGGIVDRQVQHAGVRRRRQHLQRSVRPHAQSLEHLAHLRRLDRRRRGLAGDRRGLAGARLRPWRLAAPARHLLLGRRHPPVARPRDARHLEQSLVAAVGAGADGAQRRRPRAVPRHHGGLLPARSHDLRCARRVVQRRRRAARGAEARRLHRRLRRQVRRSTARSARSAPRWRGASRSWAASSRKPRPTSAQSTRCSWRCAASSSSSTASCRSQQHRDKIKPDIIWNTELGLKQTTSRLAWAERERAALYPAHGRVLPDVRPAGDARRADRAPSTSICARPATIAGKKLENYMAGSTLNSAITVTRQPRHRRALRLRPVRPAGRPAAGRQAARRGGPAAGGVALRKAARPRQAAAHRPQAGNRATIRP